MDKAIKRCDGFSLVELLIALVIVGAILSTTMMFLRNSMIMKGDSKGSEVAQLLGQEKVVELTAKTAVTNMSDTVNFDSKQYIRSWVMTPASGSNLLSTVTVTVQFQVGSRTRSIKCYGGVN